MTFQEQLVLTLLALALILGATLRVFHASHQEAAPTLVPHYEKNPS